MPLCEFTGSMTASRFIALADLYGVVTRENFGRPGVTDYRNPHMAEAMKVLGFVQKFGMGIATAKKLLRENGNPPPEFQVEDNFVTTTLFRA